MGESSGRRGIVVGIVVPLAVVGLGYMLWWISDQLVTVGDLDRAQFGWSIVMPLWFAAPVVTGFTWRGLRLGDRAVAAITTAIVIGIAAAVLLWRSVTSMDCAFGPSHPPVEWVVPSIVLGVAIGGGMVVVGLIVAILARAGHPWRAIAAGVALQVTFTFATIFFFYVGFLAGPGCNRPPLTPG